MKRLLPLIFLAGKALGQPAVNPPAFEVADIKPAVRNEGMPRKGRLLPGGRIELPGMPLRNLIMYAYGVQENMIVGGPRWVVSEPFDIVAKAAPDTPPDTLRLMFQSLLAERFKLGRHREDKVMPAY